MIYIQNCETCRYHDADEGICVNGDSDYCAEWTEADNSCGKWECADGKE